MANTQTDFVIITALPEERDAVLSKLPDYKMVKPSEEDVRVYYTSAVPATFQDGTSCLYSVVVVCLLNMGRVEAANATGDAIRRWTPRYVIMVGIAGGMAAQGVKLGDVLLSDQVVDYELQKLTPSGPKIRYSIHRANPRLLGVAMNLGDGWRKQIRKRPPEKGRPICHQGPIATGDKVVAVHGMLEELLNDWPKLIGVEMEAGGVASASFQAASNPGFFMIRGVSDLADDRKDVPDVKSWRTYACNVAAAYLISLLTIGPAVVQVRPQLANLPEDLRQALIESILALPNIADSGRRTVLVQAMGIEIAQNIRDTSTTIDYVANMIDACMASEDGVRKLKRSLRLFYNGAVALSHTERIISNIESHWSTPGQ